MDAKSPAAADGKSYGQILKSTAMIGGSSVVNVGFAVVRNKAIAVLLGPDGMGLMGLYGSIADLTQTLAGLGIEASGVRQVAEATGTGDADRVARTAIVLKRISILLGIAGALLLAAFSLPIARLTFGDGSYAAGVVLLSAAVFFRLVSAGQTALIQGTRRIADMARINILAALSSTVISIPLVFFFGEQGIVPSLVVTAMATLLTSWWYSSKIDTGETSVSVREMSGETAALLKLGVAFMGSALLSVGAAYTIRIIVLRAEGFAAAGLYQASWALGGLYAGFILQAMGADFYPRLTAVANNNAECNRLVNEQAQISMLLAGPGVIATLMAAPLVIRLFYTPEFYPAVDVLRWLCLGMMLRVVAWPMGFVVIAKGARQIFFWAEAAATVVHVGLAWLLVSRFGTVGAGAAFFGLYVWHSILIYVIIRQFTGFRWSAANVKLGLIFLPAAGVVFAGFFLLPLWQANALGAVIIVCSGLYSLRMLLTLVPVEAMPKVMRRWLPASARPAS